MKNKKFIVEKIIERYLLENRSDGYEEAVKIINLLRETLNEAYEHGYLNAQEDERIRIRKVFYP